MRTRIKICGITRLEDGLFAAMSGADAIGFVFADSPRRIKPDEARAIALQIPPFVSRVGVFVDECPGTVRDMAEYVGLDTLQFHGDETPGYCNLFTDFKVIKTFSIGPQVKDLSRKIGKYRGCVNAFLFDTYISGIPGGTGQVFPWGDLTWAGDFSPFILAGGLSQDNVCQAIRLVRPYGVDVSSGVEGHCKGIKDKERIAKFISNVRRCDNGS